MVRVKNRHAACLTVILLGVAQNGIGGVVELEKKMQPHIFRSESGKTMNYRIHLPKSFEAGRKYPLVLFLHGAGERGADNTQQLKHGVSELLTYSIESGQPAIIIAPQCPQDKRWVEVPWDADSHTMPTEPSESMTLVLELVGKTMREEPVDPQRIYVTGISMGGYGTWDILQRRPDLFAAAMPVCGGGDPAQAKAIHRVPIWTFHGGFDTVVKPQRSRDMVAVLKQAGGLPRYTEYEGVGHDSWTRAYADHEALKWLFQQEKRKFNP